MGRWIGILVLMIVGLVLLYMFVRPPFGPTIEPGSTLVVEIAGSYEEAPRPALVTRLMGGGARSFVSLLSTFAIAERDERLERVVLHIRDAELGWGKAGELRAAVGRLRGAGRKTLALLETGGLSGSTEYFVASAADEVYLVPGAVLPMVGLAAQYIFLGGLFEQLGVGWDVAKAGKYKSAVEAYAAEGPSEASREQANSLLDSFDEQFVGGIAASRGTSVEQVRAAIDRGPVLPAELVASGFVDGIEHLEDLGADWGPVVTGDVYSGVAPSSVGFDPKARVALVYGSGVVVQGKGAVSPSGSPRFAAQSVGKALRQAAEDDSIDGIILRIDSPGGSSLASEMIWESLRRARERGKPIIASFSDVAASGGYYVAVGCDGIVSTPGALTGSIGVFALRPLLDGALDKLEVGVAGFTRGAHADFLLPLGARSEGAHERLQSLVTDIYDLFIERVAAGRKMEPSRVDAIAQGRVWTGAQAAELGLVDELGGLHEAAQRVNRALGLDPDADVELVTFPPPKSLTQQVAELLQGRLALAMPRLPVPEGLRRLERWLVELPWQSPLLIPPFLVEIY